VTHLLSAKQIYLAIESFFAVDMMNLLTFDSLTIGVMYPGYRGPPITTQNSRYDRSPPEANTWGTTQPVPGNSPTTGEGHQPKKELILGTIHTITSAPYD
jgi:hypothetical protein